MANRMTEVEGLANALFVGIFLDNLLFDGYRAGYPFAPVDVFEIGNLLEFLPLRCVSDERVLDDFGKAREELPSGQGCEKTCICPHGAGITKETDAVFYPIKIDAQFSAHGSIYLGEQGRGNLDEVHPPFEGPGTETAHVADDAAPEVEHAPVAASASLEELSPDVLAGFEGFVLFSR